MSYRNTLMVWFAAIAIVLGTVGAVVVRAVQGFTADAGRVTATHEMLEALQLTMALLTDAESGQRGYVITGRPEYLEPYHRARGELEISLQRLAGLASAQPGQRERAAKLATLVSERLDRMEQTVAARMRGFEPAQKLVLSDTGRRMTDAIRELVARTEDEERVLLAQRDADARQSARLTVWTGVGGLGTAVLIMLLMARAIVRESRRRQAVEERLLASKDEVTRSLERVQELGREMAILGSMADLLQSCRSMDEARPVIQRSLQQLLPDSAGAVCLLNSSQNLIEAVMQWGDTAGTQAVFAPDDCWSLRRGRTHVVEDARAGQRCAHLADPAPASYACLPMMAHGETLGVMFVHGANSGNEERLRLLRTASEQVSLAMANLKLQETLRIQSIRDPLTGLFNRRYLEASLERELTRAKRSRHPVCVIMVDVDHFKRFNDTFGHEAGDVVLVEVAGVLKAATREDDIACRYGGEEFTLILPEASAALATERAGQIREAIRKLHLEHRRRSLGTVTASFGIAVYPQDSGTPAGLVQAADAALYQAKQAGRDRVVLAAELAPPG